MMLEAYGEAGHEIYYVAVERYPFELSMIHPQILFTPFTNYDSSMFKLYFLAAAPAYALYVCWRNRVDLLLGMGAVNAFIQSPAKLFFRKRMVTLIRGDSEYGLRVANAPRVAILINRILERVGLFFSERIIVNNADLKEKTEVRIRKNRQNIQILYNDVGCPPPEPSEDLTGRKRLDLGIRENEFLIVTVGVINQGKNIGLILRAVKQLGIKKLRLVIVGDVLAPGDDSKLALEAMAKHIKIDDQVIFTGWKEPNEVHDILRVADLFVFPSLYEGSPNALLEALAHGKPCLGSRVPGISDVLSFDDLMFDPLNQGELAEKTRRAFLDSSYLKKITDLCEERRKAFMFDWKRAMLQATTCSSSTRDQIEA
jgi:glycosyltransferase involved in cell wall biosynthesis